jgi:hypothetical protein
LFTRWSEVWCVDGDGRRNIRTPRKRERWKK